MNCPFLSLDRLLSTGCLHLYVLMAPVLLDAASLPNDPLLDQQDILFGERGGLHLPEAWEIASSQGELEEVVVAVLSSGIRTTHEDLKNRLWINEDEIPNNGIDDDGNGYVDDVHGWNFYRNNGNIEDNYGLGTFISGTIAAEQNNGLGIAGIAPNARIMSLVTLQGNGTFVDPQSYGYKQVTYEMIQYAFRNGADIILTENQSESFIPELNELPAEFVESDAVIISYRLPWDNSFSLKNSPQFINVIPLNRDYPWYYPYSTMDFLEYHAPVLECAIHPAECYGPDASGDDSYVLHYNNSGIIAGIIALMKGAFPEDDPAMTRSRLLQGVKPDARLEHVIAPGGYLDAELAISATVEKRSQVIHAEIPRDFNVEEAALDPRITATSGLPVNMEILSGPIAMEDGRLKPTGEPGLVRLRASQDGNDAFDPAESLEVEFHISDSIQILQQEPGFDDLTNGYFGNYYGIGLHIDGDTFVSAKSSKTDERDPRAVQLRKRIGNSWPVTGYLNFPDEDLEKLKDGFRSEIYINDGRIFLAVDARDYYKGTDLSRVRVIYIYALNAETGEFEINDSIETYWNDHLVAKGRWMAFATWRPSGGLNCNLFRRDEYGTYQRIDFPDGEEIQNFHLGENCLLLDPNSAEEPFLIYELGDNPEPEFLQTLPQTPERASALIEGDWLFIGDSSNSARFPHAGAVLVYRKNNEDLYEWVQTLHGDDATLCQVFGEYSGRDTRMDIEDGVLVISALRVYGGPEFHDRQYIFTLDEDTGLWKQRYRTQVREDLLFGTMLHTYGVYLDNGWLTCLANSGEQVSFNLNDPRRLPQDLQFIDSPESVFVDQDPFELEISTTGEGDLELEVLSGPAIVEGQSIVLDGEPGEVVIQAAKQETWMFAPSETRQATIQVNKYDQELSIAPYEVPRYADSVLPFTVTASSGLKVQNQLTEGSGMFLQDGLHIFEGGDFTVEFSQEGNWKFNPAEPVTVSFQIRKDWLKLFDEWAQLQGYTGAEAEPEADPDRDGISLMQNFLFAGDPANGIPMYFPRIKITNRYYETTVQFRVLKGGPGFLLQKSVGNPTGPWRTVFEVDPEYDGIPNKIFEQKILLQRTEQPSFFRVVTEP